jgi:hypothetical protein
VPEVVALAEGKGVEISCIFVVWAQIFISD